MLLPRVKDKNKKTHNRVATVENGAGSLWQPPSTHSPARQLLRGSCLSGWKIVVVGRRQAEEEGEKGRPRQELAIRGNYKFAAIPKHLNLFHAVSLLYYPSPSPSFSSSSSGRGITHQAAISQSLARIKSHTSAATASGREPFKGEGGERGDWDQQLQIHSWGKGERATNCCFLSCSPSSS